MFSVELLEFFRFSPQQPEWVFKKHQWDGIAPLTKWNSLAVARGLWMKSRPPSPISRSLPFTHHSPHLHRKQPKSSPLPLKKKKKKRVTLETQKAPLSSYKACISSFFTGAPWTYLYPASLFSDLCDVTTQSRPIAMEMRWSRFSAWISLLVEKNRKFHFDGLDVFHHFTNFCQKGWGEGTKQLQ